MIKDITKKDTDSMSGMLTVRRVDDLIQAMRSDFNTFVANMFDTFAKDWRLDLQAFEELQPKGLFPKVNVIENPDSYDIEIAIAGFDKEDVELELKDNSLFIKADKKETVEDEDRRYLKREIAQRSFRRAVRFPAEINSDDISAKYEHGIIKCHVGKAQAEIPESVKIKISE